tara:strand:- start:2373 stop:2876 length:504 start_codon:yes stop_codon:yes gene_type:complete
MSIGSDGLVGRLKRLQGDRSARNFARQLGLGEGTYRALLRGGKPTLDTLISIADGCNVEIKWLAIGRGPMRAGSDAEEVDAGSPSIDSDLLRLAAHTVEKAHEAENLRLPPQALVAESAIAYNELLARAEDPTDRDELESLLPWLEARLRKRLKSAREDPGTGKRSA